MHGLGHLIFHYLNASPATAYSVLFIGMFFEGDTFILTAGFLAKRAVLQPVLGFIVALAGVTLGDMLWYFLGTKLEVLTPRFRAWLIKISEPLEEPIRYSLFRTLLISKFTYGLHRPLMVRVGIEKLDVYTVLKANMLACALWIGLLGLAGYTAGAALRRLEESVRSLEIGIFIGVLGLLILLYVAHRRRKKAI